MLEIILNGKTENLNIMSIHELLSKMDLLGKRIAVEINGKVIPRSLHDDTLIKTGDHIEVISAIGGG